MKQEDFDRLKAVCEKEGFELINEIDTGNEKSLVLIGVKSKDIWEGVEFVQDWFTGDIFNRDFLEVALGEDKFQPSTESAYIEQLKVESFKRFGEIKEGDRFNRLDLISFKDIKKIGNCYGFEGFRYYKDHDGLDFNGACIYQQGKWATRVKEKVKVIQPSCSWHDNKSTQFEFTCKIENGLNGLKGGEYKFLSSKLEEYLNKD